LYEIVIAKKNIFYKPKISGKHTHIECFPSQAKSEKIVREAKRRRCGANWLGLDFSASRIIALGYLKSLRREDEM
jgi:hypothetical protein